MSPEQQRIAIAEACGWRTELWVAGGWCCYSPSGDRQGFAGTSEASYCLHAPNYLNDLNAMHEAEKVLTEQFKFGDYIAALWVVTGNKPSSANFWTEKNYKGFERCIHATAAQRAEAFLRALGLWSTPAAKE